MKRSLELTTETETKRRKVTFDSKIHQSSSMKKHSSFGSRGNRDDIQTDLNKMNPMEQSRFEAFQQSTFSNTAVSNFIAACLIHANKRSARGRLNHIRLLGGDDHGNNDVGIDVANDGEISNSNNEQSSSSFEQLQQQQQQYHMPPSERAAVEAHSILSSLHHQTPNENNNNNNNKNNERPKLSDLVAPGTASKITAVVTTLAKINAQRLIQSARNIATNDYNYDLNQPLLPQHLLEAHRRRQGGRNQNGKCGFFMDLSSSTTAGGASMLEESTATTLSSDNMTVTSNEQNQMKYRAALQAQEEFDKAFNTQENEDGNETSNDASEQKTG